MWPPNDNRCHQSPASSPRSQCDSDAASIVTYFRNPVAKTDPSETLTFGARRNEIIGAFCGRKVHIKRDANMFSMFKRKSQKS